MKGASQFSDSHSGQGLKGAMHSNSNPGVLKGWPMCELLTAFNHKIKGKEEEAEEARGEKRGVSHCSDCRGSCYNSWVGRGWSGFIIRT